MKFLHRPQTYRPQAAHFICWFLYAGFLILGSMTHVQSQEISPYLIGQNAWEKNSLPLTKNQVAQVHYQMIRIGGNGYENSGFINSSAISLIDYARFVGAEPIVQMPRQLKEGNKAYDVIAYLNGKMGKKIKFWSIGNEPDHRNQLSSPEAVSDYFKKISEQIKRYDPKAKILGFDLAGFDAKYLNRLLGGDLDVTGKIAGQNYYYLDIVSLHSYKFIDIIKLEADVDKVRLKLDSLNISRNKSQKLGWAITEFNSHWTVDPKLDERYLPYTFHNGQIFAEMYDLGMRKGAFTICPWSILEGGADREGSDLSLFDLTDSVYYPRANYYHTQMLAQNFNKNYLQHSQSNPDIVVIPMGDKTGISIMVMNKSRTADYKYVLQLNTKKSKVDAILINVNAKLKKSFQRNIKAYSTQMLIFNPKGDLVKQYNYSSIDADNKIAPHISINGN